MRVLRLLELAGAASAIPRHRYYSSKLSSKWNATALKSDTTTPTRTAELSATTNHVTELNIEAASALSITATNPTMLSISVTTATEPSSATKITQLAIQSSQITRSDTDTIPPVSAIATNSTIQYITVTVTTESSSATKIIELCAQSVRITDPNVETSAIVSATATSRIPQSITVAAAIGLSSSTTTLSPADSNRITELSVAMKSTLLATVTTHISKSMTGKTSTETPIMTEITQLSTESGVQTKPTKSATFTSHATQSVTAKTTTESSSVTETALSSTDLGVKAKPTVSTNFASHTIQSVSLTTSTVSTSATKSAELAPIASQSKNFKWGVDKVQGVNLGGWLVLEGFVKPSLYLAAGSGVRDEWSFCQTLGKEEASKRLKEHWDTWVTLKDFERLAVAGINVVRIPIGFWAFADYGDPYVQGSAPYIDKAIGWARQTGMKVILDLHGAPKSQNGWEHSGHWGPARWGDADSVNKTLQVLQSIAKYTLPPNQDVVVGIEVINEPPFWSVNVETLKGYYKSAYDLIRKDSNVAIMLDDGFNPPSLFNGFLSEPEAKGVVMDHHEYQVFTPWLNALTPEQHLRQVCLGKNSFATTDKMQIVGEWSAAMTDCAPWLNGRYSGARYDGTLGGPRIGSCEGRHDIRTWDQKMKDEHRKYIEAQLDAFEDGVDGWLYWNFKTEMNAEWDFLGLVEAGVFPQPLSERKFPLVKC